MWDSASRFSTFALDIQRPVNEDKRLVQSCTINFLRLSFNYRSRTYIDGKTSFAIRFAFIACKAELCIVESLVYCFSFSSINSRIQGRRLTLDLPQRKFLKFPLHLFRQISYSRNSKRRTI